MPYQPDRRRALVAAHLAAFVSLPLLASDVPVNVTGLSTFAPRDVTVLVGDTVTWTRTGGFHNAQADDGTFRCAAGCDQTGGNGNASSSWTTATFRFVEPDFEPYHCEIHGGSGMTGTINVLRAIFVDGFEGGGPDPDRWATLVPEGDSCGNPFIVESSIALVPDTLDGSTNGTDLTTGGSCLGFASHGGDRVYRVSLPSGVSMSVTVIPENLSFDPVLYAVTAAECALATPFTCLAANDGGGAGQNETLFYTNETAGSIFVYLVVDTANASQATTGYTISISLQS